MTPYEIASLLSYLVTANPPDQELLDDVDVDGHRGRPRAAPAAPLAHGGGRTRLVRVVREWLGIDGVAELDKDSNVYPSFALTTTP